MSSSQSTSELDQLIESEFGLNSTYVSELLQQFVSNPESVDEEWRSFFREMVGDGKVQSTPENAAPIASEAPSAQEAPLEQTRSEPAPSPATAREKSPPRTAGERITLRGPALRIAENMQASLSVPTATSQRQIPIKLLDENRRLINKHLESTKRKVSFTHLIARAILKALARLPQLNDSFEELDGVSYRVRRSAMNFGLAVDVVRKDGTHTLLVPNIKQADKLGFAAFLDAYDNLVKRAREGKLQISDFQETTVSLTNPGTIGTTASNPRLMSGQGLIVATGAIEHPPEYQAMAHEALSRLGISKIITLTATYDHRIIQGAESGAFLALIEALLRGEHEFYDEVFAELGIQYRPYRWTIDINPAILGEERYRDEIRKQARVFELINAYRVRGHLIADLDPLGCKDVHYHPELDIQSYGLTIWDLDREFLTNGLGEKESAPLREILDRIRDYYCGKVGVEYRNIQDPAEKEWIRSRVENKRAEIPADIKKRMLWKLISAEQFERFLGTKYLGQKRFSIEGAETLVALLDQLIEMAAVCGVQDITIGMSHRGRLNVIANVIGHFCERIFTSFEGSVHPSFPHDQGDVKYHQGASGTRETASGETVALTVAPNPSHLEFVDPVVEGMVRAKQDDPLTEKRESKLAVLVHGDAAFAGEGIVAETLNLSQLPGYNTAGTIHVIVNNQLGFTTPPEEGRSSTYSTDVAKMIQAPIFHVNGDDVDAAYHVLQIALDYRMAFHKDIVIDVIGFRRHGHNEGDEPTYTQPLMYRRINAHPGVREFYTRKLITEGIIDEQSASSLIEERRRRYENALLGAKEIVARQKSAEAPSSEPAQHPPAAPEVQEADTSVDAGTLREVAARITSVPRGFSLNPKVVSLLGRRSKMVEGASPVDWGMAEALALGTLVTEGTHIRLSGQDTVRGTFSHRHAAFFDTQTGQEWSPLSALADGEGSFQIYDSPLSEAGVLAFEYGYSVASPPSLVLWEAQFGDFVNAAQVIVDQFIASGEEKWNQTSRLVLLLPHGYEGQGPEHSSARLERFLQLAVGNNIQVANCTTAAQYFHILRRQVKQSVAKPLVLLTPKSLLRSPDAGSNIEEFTQRGFQPVLKDDTISSAQSITRMLLCSGKIYYDLSAYRKQRQDERTAILRAEQLYPFPAEIIAKQLAELGNVDDLVWVQEEPQNMGAWTFIETQLRSLSGMQPPVRYAGRPASSSTATGSHTIHQMEQKELVEKAFGN